MATSSNPGLLLERRIGSVLEYTLNRPDKLNALSADLTAQLSKKLHQAETDRLSKIVVLRGNGRAFCAGGDVVALSLQAKEGSHEVIQQANRFMATQYNLNHLAATLDDKITVAFWHSISMGGGIGFTIPFDFRVCTPKTMIAMPECSISFFPDVGASYFLNQLRPGVGMYLALTGSRVTGYDAVLFGLATHYLAVDTIEATVQALAHAGTFAQVRRVLDAHSSSKPEDTSSAEQSLKYIDQVFTAPTLDEIFNRLEQMDNAWSKAALANMQAGSPTAVTVTFEMLSRARGLPAEACRQMEYVLHTHFMRLPDFVEGVDKKLIQKPARKPQWKPAKRQELTKAMIDAFFVAIPTDETLRLRAKVANPQKQNRFVRRT